MPTSSASDKPVVTVTRKKSSIKAPKLTETTAGNDKIDTKENKYKSLVLFKGLLQSTLKKACEFK